MNFATVVRMALLAVLSQLCAAAFASSSPHLAGMTLYERARAHEHGEGVVRSPGRAVELYCEAVRAGDSEAMDALGWMYANGRGVSRNDSFASTLFAMAAYRGNERAQRMLNHVGAHRGEVPACLIPPAREQISDVERKRRALAREIERVHPRYRPYAELIARLAPEYQIAPRLALAVARAESAFNPRALSPRRAAGLMQLIPETAARFDVADMFDPEQNVRGGLRYLRWLLAYFRGDVALALAGYNAGEAAVNRYRGVPPYPETRNYIARIRTAYDKARHAYRSDLVDPSPVVRPMTTAIKTSSVQ